MSHLILACSTQQRAGKWTPKPCMLRDHHRYNWHFDGWKMEGVQWSAMPRQIPSLIALFMVVTFGSALDVAAIQQDTPFPLDFNQELVTVGEHCLLRISCRHTANVYTRISDGKPIMHVGAHDLQASQMRWLARLVPA
jgi:hypothetical protein